MKKGIKNFMNVSLFLLAATLQLAASAALPEINMVPIPNQKKVSLRITNLKSAATLTFVDAKGEVLVKQQIKPLGSFDRLLDMESLPNGAYELKVSTDLAETVQPVEILGSTVELKEWKRKVYYAPIVRKEADFFDINWMNGRLGDLKVSILNQDGEVVFKDEFANVTKVERRYNTSKLEEGAYTVRLSTPYKTYYETLTID